VHRLLTILALASPSFHHEALENGLQFTLVPCAECPIAAVQIWYHVGSVDEQPGTLGFAHLFEHLMFGGSERYSRQDLERLHHQHGGRNNAYTSFDETVYHSEIPVEALDELLAIEADRMAHLTLSAENLANEQRIVTEELRLRAENDVLAEVMLTLQSRALPEHPYGHSPIGTKQDIARADLELAHRFYRDHYRPGRAHLVIVGPIEVESVRALVRRHFGAIEAGGVPTHDIEALIGVPPPPAVVRTKGEIPPVEIAALIYPLPPADSPDADAVRVLQAVLAEARVDPLEAELVRRRRRAIDAGVESFSFRRAGLIAFYAASLPYRRERTAWRDLDRGLNELHALRWLDDQALEGAKRRVIHDARAAEYFAAQRASAIGQAVWWQNDPARAFDLPERIDRVSLDAVRAAYQRYVQQAQPYRMYVQPENVPWYVRWFGWLAPLVTR
jgi:zinc protease